MEVYEERQDLEPVRELLGHARIDTTQIYARIRPPQLKRAVAFYEERAEKVNYIELVAQTGFDSEASLSHLPFEGLAVAA